METLILRSKEKCFSSHPTQLPQSRRATALQRLGKALVPARLNKDRITARHNTGEPLDLMRNRPSS